MTKSDNKEMIIIEIPIENKDYIYLKKYGFMIEKNIKEYLKDIINEMKRLDNK